MAQSGYPSEGPAVARSEIMSKARSKSSNGSSHETIQSLEPPTSMAVHPSDVSHHSGSAYDSALFPQPGSLLVENADSNHDASNLPSSSTGVQTSESGSGEQAAAGVHKEFVGAHPTSQFDLRPHSVRQAAAKHHRELDRITQLIDDELQKRTHWRREQQKLTYFQNWLIKSTDALVEALTIRSTDGNDVDYARTNIKEGEHGVPLETIDSAVSLGLTGSPAVLEPNSSTRESIRNERLPSSTDVESETTAGDRVTELLDVYHKDCHATQKQEKIVAVLTHELGYLDFRLSNGLQELRTRLHPDGSLQLGEGLQGGSVGVFDTHSSSRSGASTPSLVRDYFDKLGDVGIYTERLDELIDTHEEGLIEREFLRDKGDDVSVPDDEFMAIYLERRDQIREDISRAEKHADALRQACEEAGHNIELHRGQIYSMEPPSSSESAPSNSEEETSPIPSIHWSPFTAVSNQPEPTSTSRVDEWIQRVFAESSGENSMASLQDESLYPEDEPLDI